MPVKTDGDIAVVKPYYAVEEAYNMAYDKFEGMEDLEDEDFDLAPYQSSADYANNVLPSLRAMAGYGDAGHGTFQQNREVAAIHPGCEEDDPAEADLTEATYVFDQLVSAFSTGAYDAAAGRERDPSHV